MVAELTPSPKLSSVREPIGCADVIYSRTTNPRTSCCLGLKSSIILLHPVICPFYTSPLALSLYEC
jgi:hypothetical protein